MRIMTIVVKGMQAPMKKSLGRVRVGANRHSVALRIVDTSRWSIVQMCMDQTPFQPNYLCAEVVSARERYALE